MAATNQRRWLLGLSIVVQQVLLLYFAGEEIMLLHVSSWVSRVPIVILWCVYLIAPFVYLRPVSAGALLKSYALAGWLFVAAAFAWHQSYWLLCEKYGVPVSWDQVSESYQRGESARFEEAVKKRPNQ